MIGKSVGLAALFSDILPRVEVAHGDLTRIAGILGNPSARVFTGQPLVENGERVQGYNVSGWFYHFSGEIAAFRSWLASADPAVVDALPHVRPMVEGYLDSAPRVVAALAALLREFPPVRYGEDEDGSVEVPDDRQAQLAATIAAELA